MSTPLLYHGLGAHGYKYLHSECISDSKNIHLVKNKSRQCCAACGSKNVVKKGMRIRRIRTLPVGDKQVFFCLHVHRLKCKKCGKLRQEKILLVDPKKRFIFLLSSYILSLLKMSTVLDVANLLKMSWNTIKKIHLKELQSKYAHIPLENLRYL